MKEYTDINHAFNQINSRRRMEGLKEFTSIAEYQEYMDEIVKVDSKGRVANIIKESLKRAIKMFGIKIIKTKKECKYCGEKKLEKDFYMRFNVEQIDDICKDCNNRRIKESKTK